jgi:hypothetical protein
MKLSLSKLYDLIEEQGYKGRIKPILTVHDELITENHNSVPKEVAVGILTEALRFGTQTFCPKVRIEVGDADCNWSSRVIKTWGDLK